MVDIQFNIVAFSVAKCRLKKPAYSAATHRHVYGRDLENSRPSVTLRSPLIDLA